MANTNKGRKLYICAAAKAVDLSQSEFEALTWVEVKNVGSIGESGTKTNIVQYNELATVVSQKHKGISDAGDPVVEVARNPTDPGQILLRAAGLTSFYYATKVEDNDKPQVDFTNSIYYMRGLITGPVRMNGKVEDFILEQYTLGNVQPEIVVDPVAGSVPVNTVGAALSGIVQTGQLLTAHNGEWTNFPTGYTYQWQHDTAGNATYVDQAGATAKTYTPLVGNVGNSWRVKVYAVNGAGTSAVSTSPGTVVQAA